VLGAIVGQIYRGRGFGLEPKCFGIDLIVVDFE